MSKDWEPGAEEFVDACHDKGMDKAEDTSPAHVAENADLISAGVMAGVYGTLKVIEERGLMTEELKRLICGVS